MKIAEILKMQDKMPVELSAKVEKVYDMQERDHAEYGRQTSQSVLVSDDTGKVYLQCKNLLDMKRFEGQTIHLKCSETKNGLMGVKKDSYVSKKTNERKVNVVVTKTAQITTGDAPVAPKTSAVASTSHVPTPNGAKDRDVMMMVSYAKDLAGALIANGVEPEEATNKAFEMVSNLYSKVMDMVIGTVKETLQPKKETTEELANRLFDGDGQE